MIGEELLFGDSMSAHEERARITYYDRVLHNDSLSPFLTHWRKKGNFCRLISKVIPISVEMNGWKKRERERDTHYERVGESREKNEAKEDEEGLAS